MGGDTLRGGVSGVPIALVQCSTGRVKVSSPIALRTGLQLLMACWGSGRQQMVMLLPPPTAPVAAVTPPHIAAPVCTLYATPPTATAAEPDKLPGFTTGYDVVVGRVAGIGLEE